MKPKLKIDTRVRRLVHYLEDIASGKLRVPAFQRDFVWQTKDKLDLFDSLKNGFPIGSLLFWKSEEAFSEDSKVGPFKIKHLEREDDFFFVLDGFQRLSTLFGCLSSPKSDTYVEFDEKEWRKSYHLVYDLETQEFVFPRSQAGDPFQIPLHVLIDTFAFLSFTRALFQACGDDHSKAEELIGRAQSMATILADYTLPSIDIVGGGMEDAVLIFSRINSKGQSISTDWMISALTYNRDKDFRLGTLIDDLLAELKFYNFDQLKREVVFQCITHSFGDAFFDQSNKIEALAKRNDFIPVARQTLKSIELAVKYLFEKHLVVDVKLLPYNIQLIFITDFFNSVSDPTESHLAKLGNWFWITTYSNYFTIYSLSKQREAYKRFREFLKDEMVDPVYNDQPKLSFSTLGFPTKVFFGSVRAKALMLFMLNFSNGFKPVQGDEIEGFDLDYLSIEKRDEKGNPKIGGLFISLNFAEQRGRKMKGVTHYLTAFDSKYAKYFINETLSYMYKELRLDELLNTRQAWISLEEKVFVEKLGIAYSEE